MTKRTDLLTKKISSYHRYRKTQSKFNKLSALFHEISFDEYLKKAVARGKQERGRNCNEKNTLVI